MFVEDLRNKILLEPIVAKADKLCVISGYATPGMASWHMQTIFERKYSPININLIVGMCPKDGLSVTSHKGFQNIIQSYNKKPNYSRFNCQYVFNGYPAVHSKLYLWFKKEIPLVAYTGSANYTQTAFEGIQREILTECNAHEAKDYFDFIERQSIYCMNNEVEDCIQLTRSNPRYEDEPVSAFSSTEHITLSLLSKNGEVGTRSGLNWGQRDRREPNQAYIPLPTEIARTKFFPVRDPADSKAPHFTVLTDDNKSLILRVEQDNDKAITTPENNSKLGEYFRNRLGLPSGAPVWKSDLQRYGRTDVTFYKIDDEQYFMDFSV